MIIIRWLFLYYYIFFSGRVNVKCLVDNVVFKCNDEVCIYFLSYIVICIFVMMRYLGGGGGLRYFLKIILLFFKKF